MGEKDDEEKMTSSTTMLMAYSFIFLVYYLLRFFLVDNYSLKNKSSILSIILTLLAFLIITIFQLTTNFKNTKVLCGTVQFSSAVSNTVLPMVLIMGGLSVCMGLFPGWKAPFSNTLGYGVTMMLGIQTVFNNMLKTNAGDNKLLQKVVQDKSILINLMTPGKNGTFDKVMEQLSGGPAQKGGAMDLAKGVADVGNNNNNDAVTNVVTGGNGIFNPQYKDYESQLYNLVLIKDYIAEFTWLLLAGFLTIQTSFNQLIGIECKKSEAQLEKSMGDFATKSKRDAKNAEKPKKFKVFD